MGWTVADAIRATGGRLVQGNPEASLNGFSTDTRSIQSGSCFVALLGERHDGHAYLDDAAAKKVSAVIVGQGRVQPPVSLPAEVAVIDVQDTLRALGDLARYHRRLFEIPLVGITGSNGKTSTKEMVAAILSRRRRILKSSGNFNNLIGVPLTLLSLEPEHEAAVVEMGINVPGEMARMVEMADPTIGLITNIHPAHLEGLHSVDQILEEKGKLWEGLGPRGVAVVNKDDENLRAFAQTLNLRRIMFSVQDASEEVALVGSVEMTEEGSSFNLSLAGNTVPIHLSVLGDHHVANAVAAAAVSWAMGEGAEAIAEGLADHKPVKQRMQTHLLRSGRVLVDDSYNANPRSMIAAVQAVRKASRGRPVVAVLGDMKELGPKSPLLHHEVGRKIGELGIEELITLGQMSREIAAGAQEVGLPAQACRHAQSHEEIVEWLAGKESLREWILVKGSRSMTMEKVIDGLLSAEDWRREG